MNKSYRAVLALATAAVAPASFAQGAAALGETRPYINALYTYTAEEDRRATEEGQGGYFGVGKAINEYVGLEFGAFLSEFDNRPGSAVNFREYGAKLDGLFFYSRNPKFSPYFGLGVGSIQTDEKSTGLSSTDPFADVGVGFFKYFTLAGTDLGFRTDLRHRRVFFDENAFGGTNVDDLGETVVKVGLVLPLGPKSVPVAPVTAAVIDSDGDGVPDSADLCPGTARGVKVDDKGCPIDETKDQGPARKFEDVYFAFDKSDLTDYAKATLDNAAGTINSLVTKHPTLKVDVSGHTDWVGTDGYNQGLSERRAGTVKDYLVRKGVDASRISTYAYGESRPVAPNETDEGRALNRRAEIRTRAD